MSFMYNNMDKSNGEQKKLEQKEYICYDFVDEISKNRQN